MSGVYLEVREEGHTHVETYLVKDPVLVEIKVPQLPAVAEIYVPGIQGAPGATGGSGTYTHTQTSPAIVWLVMHNLGFKAQPFVRSLDGAQMLGFTVDWPSDDYLLLIFPSAQSGTCIVS